MDLRSRLLNLMQNMSADGTGAIATLATRGSQPDRYTFRANDVIAGEAHCALDYAGSRGDRAVFLHAYGAVLVFFR